MSAEDARDTGDSWDRRTEWRTALILAAGFSLVGVDRFIIVPLFPVMMKELHLTYQDLGIVTGALAFTWGLAALLMGDLSDQLGRRAVLVGSMIAFSLLVGLSGLATGLWSLVCIRSLMGLAEGAFTAPSIAATMEAARPGRRGRMLGVQQMIAPLFSLALVPIIATQLLKITDWRWIFLFSAMPGVLLAFLIARFVREARPCGRRKERIGWRSLLAGVCQTLRYPDVKWLMLAMACWLNTLVVLSMLLPGYLSERRHLTPVQISQVISAMGFGAVLGSAILPTVSDYLGRRRTLVLGATTGTVAVTVMSQIGASPWPLFACLFVVMFCTYGSIGLTIGPAAADAVSKTLHATASGVVIAAGEIFGGGIAPLIGGRLANIYGTDCVFSMVAVGLVIAIVACSRVRGYSPALLGSPVALENGSHPDRRATLENLCEPPPRLE